MNLFKDGNVNLHKSEKMFLLMNTVLTSLMFSGLGYGFVTVLGGFYGFIGFCMIAVSLIYTIMTFRALSGKGINSSDT
ncbi:hypothetical protein [Siminovitchia fordii]|uniref:Uncharacterized protein n=1 Tax=Siminovitchia fordii TaxID=254759 RepID=A0ABQ4K9Z4_9BACI|nr:hypothetical protein [Siminovitchia fordii]GIN22549.1 hypothetical protein J1TS3_36830 [Siminovitchia fordii]